MNSPHVDPKTDDDALARLIGEAGPRHVAPAAITAQVRAAVHAEWQQRVQQRKRQRQFRWLAAASVLVGIMSIAFYGNSGLTGKQSPPSASVTNAVLASISYLNGSALLNARDINPQQAIHATELLRTGPASGARIATSTGISLRVAAASELRWINEHEIQLLQGALYVDSHDNIAALIIHTPQADVTHVGTQYQVNSSNAGLSVAVRSGETSIRATGARDASSMHAREQVRIDASGQTLRSTLANDDASWQWADALVAPFALENHTVAEFLQWVATETGHELHYTNTAARTAASTTVLHGQSTRMTPLQAMQVVLATTDLRATVQGAQLVVSQQ